MPQAPHTIAVAALRSVHTVHSHCAIAAKGRFADFTVKVKINAEELQTNKTQYCGLYKVGVLFHCVYLPLSRWLLFLIVAKVAHNLT